VVFPHPVSPDKTTTLFAPIKSTIFSLEIETASGELSIKVIVNNEK